MRHIEIPPDTTLVGAEPGAAPMLQWLKIADLVIDDTYQRDLKKDNWRSIHRIADRFKWSRFSPVFVAPIEGGKYAIIDGQHRTHAAALAGLDSVPCQIVQMTKEEQAASFAAVNGMVTKVTGFQILKAAIVAGEKWALRAVKICADAGCILMTSNGSADQKKPGEIYPIALIRKLAADGKGAVMTAVLTALRQSKFGQSAEAYTNDMLKPMFLAVNDRPQALSADFDLVKFFDSFDFAGAQDRVHDFIKTKRRQGIAGVTGFDIMAGELREGIDKALGRATAPAGLIGVAAAPAPAASKPAPIKRPEPSRPVPDAAKAGAGKFRLKNDAGLYLDRFGTAFTDKLDRAWSGSAEQAEAAMGMKPILRGCTAVPA